MRERSGLSVSRSFVVTLRGNGLFVYFCSCRRLGSSHVYKLGAHFWGDHRAFVKVARTVVNRKFDTVPLDPWVYSIIVHASHVVKANAYTARL